MNLSQLAIAFLALGITVQLAIGVDWNSCVEELAVATMPWWEPVWIPVEQLLFR